MIGTRLTNPDGSTWTVTGQHGGAYIIVPVDQHGSPEAVSAAELAARFEVARPDEPADVDEQAGWDALRDAAADAAVKVARGDVDPGPTPEQRIAQHAAETDAPEAH